MTLALAAAEKNIKNVMGSRTRELALLVTSSVLLVLPFHIGGFWPLAFVAFVPAFFVLRHKKGIEAFGASFIFGFVYFLLLGFWLAFVNPAGLVVTVAYLALAFAFFGSLVSPYLNHPKLVRSLLFIPSVWVVLEFLRGWMFGGIPWALLAYSQWKNVVAIQFAEITGAYGVSFFIVLVNFILFKLIERKTAQTALLTGVLAGSILLVGGYGFLSLFSRDAYYKNVQSPAVLRVSVIQGNVPQDQKWNAKVKGIIFEKYRRLTAMSASEKADLIVWPETSFPGYLEDEPLLSSQLRSLVRQCRTEVLVGAPTLGDLEQGLRFYNSAILYGADGEEKKRYSKLHLVPFGEFVPFEPLFGFVRMFGAIGHFSPGREYSVFNIRSRNQKPTIEAKFSVLICFEDTFPALVRTFCRHGAHFLINITNDAWFGKTTAPYQHAQASIFRAVENRVWVVRAANTGLSCFISPEGRVVDSVQDNGQEIFVTGRKAHDLILRKTPSFYTRFGDVFVIITLGLVILALRGRFKDNTYSS